MALAFLLVPVLPAAAATFLVVLAETRDGEPARPPLFAREGILAVLFEDGHIAFDLPAGTPQPAEGDLPRLGLQAGAEIVARIVVDWHEERLVGGATMESCRGNILLVDPKTGRRSELIALELGNLGREGEVGRSGLGREIGTLLIRAWQASPPVR